MQFYLKRSFELLWKHKSDIRLKRMISQCYWGCMLEIESIIASEICHEELEAISNLIQSKEFDLADAKAEEVKNKIGHLGRCYTNNLAYIRLGKFKLKIHKK